MSTRLDSETPVPRLPGDGLGPEPANAPTPILALNKPDVGADDDVWGDLWNANADILDAALLFTTPASRLVNASVAVGFTPPPADAAPMLLADRFNAGLQTFNAYTDTGGQLRYLTAGISAFCQLQPGGGALAIETFPAGAAGAVMPGANNYVTLNQTGWTHTRSLQVDAGQIALTENIGLWEGGSSLRFGTFSGYDGAPVTTWAALAQNAFAPCLVGAPGWDFAVDSAGNRFINWAPQWFHVWEVATGTFAYTGPAGELWHVDNGGNTAQMGACYATAYPGPSDARLKTDIAPWRAGLDALLQLAPMSFRYNGSGGVADDGRRHVGIGAQDLAPIMPECVHVMDARWSRHSDQLAVDPAPLVYACVNAIRELHAKIVHLQEQIEFLGGTP